MPAVTIPAATGVPGGAVVVPREIAGAPGLHVWPRLILPRGAMIVYILQVLRPPEAPGRAVRSEVVYVGRTRHLARRLVWHERQAGLAFDDCLYWIEEADRAEVFASALIKLFLPMGNKKGKTGGLSRAERMALDRWDIKH